MSVKAEGSKNSLVNGCNQLTQNGAAVWGHVAGGNPQKSSSIKPPRLNTDL